MLLSLFPPSHTLLSSVSISLFLLAHFCQIQWHTQKHILKDLRKSDLNMLLSVFSKLNLLYCHDLMYSMYSNVKGVCKVYIVITVWSFRMYLSFLLSPSHYHSFLLDPKSKKSVSTCVCGCVGVWVRERVERRRVGAILGWLGKSWLPGVWEKCSWQVLNPGIPLCCPVETHT